MDPEVRARVDRIIKSSNGVLGAAQKLIDIQKKEIATLKKMLAMAEEVNEKKDVVIESCKKSAYHARESMNAGLKASRASIMTGLFGGFVVGVLLGIIYMVVTT